MRIVGVIFHRLFEKDFKKLDKSIKETFSYKRNLMLIDPYHPILNNHFLHGKWKGYFSINITGDIRVVYKVVNNIAIFYRISTHSELYE